MLDLLDINSQECHTFVENFSNIVEHSPLIAGTLWSLKPFKSVDHFVLVLKVSLSREDLLKGCVNSERNVALTKSRPTSFYEDFKTPAG